MQLGVMPLWHDLPVTNLMEDGLRRLRNEQARKVAESGGRTLGQAPPLP